MRDPEPKLGMWDLRLALPVILFNYLMYGVHFLRYFASLLTSTILIGLLLFTPHVFLPVVPVSHVFIHRLSIYFFSLPSSACVLKLWSSLTTCIAHPFMCCVWYNFYSCFFSDTVDYYVILKYNSYILISIFLCTTIAFGRVPMFELRIIILWLYNYPIFNF